MNNTGINPIFKSGLALDMSALFTMDRYYIQTKFLRIFGGAFWFKDANDQVIAYSKQKRFKLKEDIVQLRYIKVKKIAPNIDMILDKYSSFDFNELEDLEEYCLQFAEQFFLQDLN